MLVVISDLHLTDGTSGEIISDSAFRVFKNRLSDMAYDASWRRSSKACPQCTEELVCSDCYRPVESADVLLLGDILDAIRSEKWNQLLNDVMPWTKPHNDSFYEAVDEIVTGILSFNESSLRILKGIGRDGDVLIPGQMRRAGAASRLREKIDYKAGEQKVPVPMNLYYMVGNHDWFFYIDDPRMIAITDKVIEALGLANEKGKPFPHRREDCAAVLQTQNRHQVFAEHGDKFDTTNFQQLPGRTASSVGDVVVIKMLNKIPGAVGNYLLSHPGNPYSKEKVIELVGQLREIDNLRPYALAPAWIMHIKKQLKMEHALVNEAVGKAVQEVLVDFARNELVAANGWLAFKMRFAAWLLRRFISIDTLGKLLQHTSYVKDNMESYKEHAVTMARNQQKAFFVMGHTHYAEVVPLRTYVDNAGVVNEKIYINTGTWRTVHVQGIEGNYFISYKTMTIAGFFTPDERKGRAFEYWTGALAL